MALFYICDVLGVCVNVCLMLCMCQDVFGTFYEIMTVVDLCL